MSNLFPATLDAQPLNMQKRIQEMFGPLLSAVQQRDTEAQRLQTAGERNDALNKQAAEEQKAESKDCSFCVPTSSWLVSQWFAPETRPDSLSTPTYLQPQESEEVAHTKGSDNMDLQEFNSFVTLSPSSSLRCLFLFRFLPTSSGSCRCSRPNVFLPPLHRSPSALSPLRLFSLSLLSRSFSLSSPLFLLLTEDSLLSSLFVFVGPLHLSRSSSSFILFHFFSLYFYIFIFVLPFHLSHSSSIFFLYSPLDPLANELEQ